MNPFEYGRITKLTTHVFTIEYRIGHVEPPKGWFAVYFYNGKIADYPCISPHDKGDWTYSWPNSKESGPIARGQLLWQEGHIIPEHPRSFWWYRDGHEGRPIMNMQEKQWEFDFYEKASWKPRFKNTPHTNIYRGVTL